MSKSELEKLRAQMKAAPFSPTAPEWQLRAGIDALESFGLPDDVRVEICELGAVPADRLTGGSGDGAVLLYLHGGGYVIGSPRSHRHLAALIARQMAGTVYVLDYRLAPEAPFPAAVDDALAAYRALLAEHPPQRLAIAGDSAGGGLTFALAIAARDAGLAMPTAIVGISPWVNLGTENESYDKLAANDPVLSREVTEYFSSRYLAGAPARTPLASPLFANLAGLPPTLIQVGDHECFFGDATSMHQALIASGVDTELVVWKGMFHVWHLYWPALGEGKQALEQIAAFVTQHCG